MAASQFVNSQPSEEPQGSYGWLGTVSDFLETAPDTWLTRVQQQYARLYRQRATATQQAAWQDEATVLRSTFQALATTQPGVAYRWTLIFEYELPREGGRRPDLVILTEGSILVLEFKQKSHIAPADVDQVAAYARDLSLYHSASQNRPVLPLLLLTRRTKAGERRNGVDCLSPPDFLTFLTNLPASGPTLEAESWVQADYAPLPTVVQAARRIFTQVPLPHLRRAQSAGIPDLLATLNQLVTQASQTHERHLVLITGVPGAGKTLVGLQFVHQNPLAYSDQAEAVYLTGNGPLLQVLQYALNSRVFVQAARNFYLQHEARRQTAPPEHIIVFDEAQRAWDANRMAEKYGIQQAAGGTVLRIAERIPDWSMVVALIGEGQEIHVGEEDDIDQWQVGLQQAESPWHVHCPPRYRPVFQSIADQRLHPHDQFDLTTSLRTHQASHLQTWVNHLLLGDLQTSAEVMPLLIQAGFRAYLTRDLDQAKQYCRDRYAGSADKRYGLIASSRARNLPKHGIPNDYVSTVKVKTGPWYIDPPESPFSCCQLDQVVTEFGCQGLELDFPIVAWGSDLVWREDRWVCTSRQRQVRDPQRLRLNSYRVLLTRGRDGCLIVVPPDAALDDTFRALRQSGLPLLSEESAAIN